MDKGWLPVCFPARGGPRGETCFSQAGLGRPLCLLARGVPWGGIEVHFTILGSDGLGSLRLTLFDHLMDLFESFSQAF